MAYQSWIRLEILKKYKMLKKCKSRLIFFITIANLEGDICHCINVTKDWINLQRILQEKKFTSTLSTTFLESMTQQLTDFNTAPIHHSYRSLCCADTCNIWGANDGNHSLNQINRGIYSPCSTGLLGMTDTSVNPGCISQKETFLFFFRIPYLLHRLSYPQCQNKILKVSITQ